MELEAFIIFAVCLAGGIYTSYVEGVKKGSETTLILLEEQKLIKVHEDGEIEPYK
jgi:hypothetical protein